MFYVLPPFINFSMLSLFHEKAGIKYLKRAHEDWAICIMLFYKIHLTKNSGTYKLLPLAILYPFTQECQTRKTYVYSKLCGLVVPLYHHLNATI